MIPSLKLHPERLVALQHLGQNLLSRLDKALGPPRLLGLESCHLNGKLSRTLHVLQVNEFPTFELRAIREISILGKRIVLPPSSFLDSAASPDASRSIEVKKNIAARAPRMLQHKMAVSKIALTSGRKELLRM